jgi:Na+-transporting methylmalonyl-CoA/oxaloacetate decarboxylase gamma subunit
VKGLAIWVVGSGIILIFCLVLILLIYSRLIPATKEFLIELIEDLIKNICSKLPIIYRVCG